MWKITLPGYSRFIDREIETLEGVAGAKSHLKKIEGEKNQGLTPTQQDETGVSKRGPFRLQILTSAMKERRLLNPVPV